ncbi:MAG: ferric reductase-like transmembrane domain-containing protein [Chloroflexi bacterium]|uniref:Ferric reductase-like transmembrane domain-containing protein n=1 Tax=Candidatus Chlorohelix allophototropha TaxID=3003348 RepID=A0A8T7M572_9CHLR|nr:ferric reductase-like transmembrane domain-containing protein [Chloroflexota bacterium]WJW69185.1 ferric reductase-like transmembrane domain-containing protein [Chloroflexota bacterium L227-S17]
MAAINKPITLQASRPTTNMYLAGTTFIGCIVASFLAAPGQSVIETLTLGTGYVGLLLVMVTLVMGPLNMLKVRKNPVNMISRRDVGIWAAMNIIAHVIFTAALQISWGSTLFGLFLNDDGSIKTNLFGISDIFGLLGALTILFLLVLSNNFFLKKLKGKNWKTMQRFNYLLFVVALVHALTQQINVGRGLLMSFVVIALAATVIVAQFIGFVVYRSRSQQRKNAAVQVPTTAKSSVQASNSSRVTAQSANSRRVNGATVMTTSNRRPNSASRQAYNYRNVQTADNAAVKMVLYSVLGIIAVILGIGVAKMGSDLMNNSDPYSTSNSYYGSSSSNSSGANVSRPSYSQPVVRSRHS